MGKQNAKAKRHLLDKANDLLRDGTVEGAKKAHAQLKLLEGEVGNDRARSGTTWRSASAFVLMQ